MYIALPLKKPTRRVKRDPTADLECDPRKELDLHVFLEARRHFFFRDFVQILVCCSGNHLVLAEFHELRGIHGPLFTPHI
jgi:hypothetical protein